MRRAAKDQAGSVLRVADIWPLARKADEGTICLGLVSMKNALGNIWFRKTRREILPRVSQGLQTHDWEDRQMAADLKPIFARNSIN
jgi:hypothetical protein